MGMRPSADLIYGLVPAPGDDWSQPEPDAPHSIYEGTDFDESVLFVYGISKPDYDQVPAGSSYYTELRRAMDAAPITVGTWGGADSEGLFLGVRASHTNADWDSAQVIESETLVVLPEWNDQVREFCRLTGIPYREPRWHLLCSYH